MSTTIYFLRHGEVYNPEGIIYARLPYFGLSNLGKKQLKQTATFLSDKNVESIYSSPLTRTIQSAGIIKKILNLETIHISKEILEVKTSYQGKKFSNLDQMQSEIYLKPLSPDDETLDDIAKRMKHFVDELIKKHENKTVAAVTHGDPIMVLRALIEKEPLVLSSIGKGGKISYIQHGEVYQVTIDADKNLSIKEVFKPTI